MSLVKQKDNSFYFIHIPRTAGRYVKKMFESSSDVQIKNFKNDQTSFNNIEVVHLHYPLYLDYFPIEDIPHITIVRNPYDKFLSVIKYIHFLYGNDFKSTLIDEKIFFEYVWGEILEYSAHNNWFLPQYRFTSPKTHFWNYENGFGKNFVDWIFDITNVKIDVSNLDYEYMENEKQSKEIPYELDKVVESYVKKFYNLDYLKFGYDL